MISLLETPSGGEAGSIRLTVFDQLYCLCFLSGYIYLTSQLHRNIWLLGPKARLGCWTRALNAQWINQPSLFVEVSVLKTTEIDID